MPHSWDTFCTTINNYVPIEGLIEANVASNLVTKEVNRKNAENTRADNALNVRGRSTDRGKSQERARSKSKFVAVWKT